MRVNLALAGGFYGEVDHVLVVGDYGGLGAVGLGGGHAAEGLQRQDHVGQVLVGVVDILGDFEVAFAAAAAGVVVGVAEALELVLVDQVVADSAQGIEDLVVLALEDDLGEFELGQLVAVGPLDFGARVDFPGGRQDGALFESLVIAIALDYLVDHVGDPGADGLDNHLGALALEELEHIEVAVALGGLGPEFAGDLDDGLDAEAVDFDLVEAVAHLV